MSTIKREPDLDTPMTNGHASASTVVVPAGLSEAEKQVYIALADYPVVSVLYYPRCYGFQGTRIY